MRVEVRPAARSTAEAPLFLWRVWQESKPVAFGITPSRAEAESMAALAVAQHQAPSVNPCAWLEELLRDVSEDGDAGLP